jgi:hypothetical protein
LVEIDFIAPHLLGALPAGSKGLVNRLANRKRVSRAELYVYCSRMHVVTSLQPHVCHHTRCSAYWVEIVIVSDYLNYTLPMTIAGCCILAFTIAVTL